MNIALGALLLFLLLFPGILLRMAYLNGPYSRKNIQTSLVDELILSLVPALFMQGTGYLLVNAFSGYRVRLLPVYQLIVGASHPQYHPDFKLIEASLPLFLGYCLVMFGLALSLGKAARYGVERLGLDILVHSLRFNNEWYYLLSGRILDFPGWPGQAREVADIWADVLVESKEGSYLYCGVLDEFYFGKEGLDRICLSQVYRRKLGDDLPDEAKPETKSFDARYYEMPGDLFVIPYAQVRNLNLTYLRLSPVAAPEPTEGPQS